MNNVTNSIRKSNRLGGDKAIGENESQKGDKTSRTDADRNDYKEIDQHKNQNVINGISTDHQSEHNNHDNDNCKAEHKKTDSIFELIIDADNNNNTNVNNTNKNNQIDSKFESKNMYNANTNSKGKSHGIYKILDAHEYSKNHYANYDYDDNENQIISDHGLQPKPIMFSKSNSTKVSIGNIEKDKDIILQN